MYKALGCGSFTFLIQTGIQKTCRLCVCVCVCVIFVCVCCVFFIDVSCEHFVIKSETFDSVTIDSSSPCKIITNGFTQDIAFSLKKWDSICLNGLEFG